MLLLPQVAWRRVWAFSASREPLERLTGRRRRRRRGRRGEGHNGRPTRAAGARIRVLVDDTEPFNLASTGTAADRRMTTPQHVLRGTHLPVSALDQRLLRSQLR